MAIVGEAIVSASLKVLFDKLASPIITEFGSLWGIENDLAKLQTTLRMIQAVLNNAGQRQTKEEAVKIWLDELNHLAYDAEDILDEYAIHVERLKLKSDQHLRFPDVILFSDVFANLGRPSLPSDKISNSSFWHIQRISVLELIVPLFGGLNSR
uniref:Disease resistance N-terminal domain-containing protein n=1 Tax=Nelumbo nucifera TaxID=4432 RepID=A0A822ZK58_NELNU|nr:TPA_asm: hypothetical protein HUJ06_003487 [Nelumbo nucifera]